MFEPIISESQLSATSPIQPANSGFNANPLIQQSSPVSGLHSCQITEIHTGKSADPMPMDAEPMIAGLGRTQLTRGLDQRVTQAASLSQTSTRQTDSLAPVGVNANDAWIRNNIDDRALQTALLKRSQDGQLDRTDMLHIFDRAEDGNRVDRQEFRDLQQVVNGRLKTLMPEFVQNLASKVVNGDFANRNYQGDELGNLTAGSSGSHLDKLVGKWFLGTDRPNTENDDDEDYAYRRINRVLFKDGVSFQDIVQGNVGNCYFLASLGAVAKDSPATIQNMFIDNGDKTYTVRFFKGNQAEYVTVDSALPIKNGKSVFADYKRELWVALAEKAYAQLNESGWIRKGDDENSYQGIDSGWSDESTQQITGLDTRWVAMNQSTSASLIQAFQNNQMVVLSSKNTLKPSEKIVDNHAYTLLNYDSTTGLFTVYNPWGLDNDRSRVKDKDTQDGKIELTWKEIKRYFGSWQALK